MHDPLPGHAQLWQSRLFHKGIFTALLIARILARYGKDKGGEPFRRIGSMPVIVHPDCMMACHLLCV